MMLDWLGLGEAEAAVRSAVETALAQGHATPDLGGDLRTAELTDRIIECIQT